MQKIYLDNAATTPLAPGVLEAMMPYFTTEYMNPAAGYWGAQAPADAIRQARMYIADYLAVSPSEIYFTSGGSESNNWAIRGVAEKYGKGHIITSAIEHHSVLNVCKYLETQGFSVTYLPVWKEGIIRLHDLINAIRKDTILISIMTANNEVGSIQPIQDIANIAHEHDILFHTDAVQAVKHIQLNADYDLLSASAHKFGGPKGIGFLYKKNYVMIENLIYGGMQENGLRGGTSNVPGIVGMSKAIKYIPNPSDLSAYFIDKVLKEIPNVILTGDCEKRLPYHASFIFKGVSGIALQAYLSEKGIYCSTGSACNTGSSAPSHVLTSMGYTPEEAGSSLRFTLSHWTTKEDIDYTMKSLKEGVKVLT